MIDGVTNGEAIPVLERLLQFAGARHRMLTDNIANLDTPGFRPMDVSPERFQEALGEAIDAKRSAGGPIGSPLPTINMNGVTITNGRMTLNPEAAGENILFHDQNDRDLERSMQDLVENFMTFRLAADLIRNQFDLINTAIRERI